LPAEHSKTKNVKPHQPYNKQIPQKNSEKPKTTKKTARKSTQIITIDPQLPESSNTKKKVTFEQAQSQNQTPMQLSSTQPNHSEDQEMVPVNKQTRNTIQERIKTSKYNLTEDVMNRKANITIGQLLQINPRMHGELTKNKIQSYMIEPTKTGFGLADLNITNDQENSYTATRAKIIVNDKTIDCLIDCGASKCIMDRNTKEMLGLEIDSSSNTTFTLGNNSTVASLGLIYDVAITIGNVTIPINVEVLEATPMPLIIGNNWLQKAKARIDFTLTNMSVEYRKKSAEIPILIEKESNPQQLLSKQSTYHYFKPVYEEIEQEANAEYEEEETDSEENDEFMNYQNNFQDLSQVPHIENDTLAYLQVKSSNDSANVILHQGDTMIIPSKSNAPINIHVPQSSSKQIIEINENYHHYLTLDNVFLEPHQKKLQTIICNHTDDPIMFDGQVPVATIHEISDIEGYEVNDIFSNMNLISPTLENLQELPDEKKKLFPTFESDNIPVEISKRLHHLLFQYQDIFDWDDGTPTKTTNIIQHEIITEDHPPIRNRPYRMSPEESVHLRAELDKYLRLGIIRPSKSPWASPIILVKKKNDDYRLVINYKKLNAITKKDAYPLPRIDDILDSLGTSTVFSSLDMRNAFFLISMKDNDANGQSGSTSVEKSGFITKYGSFEMVRMGQGLCNSPSTFQRCVDICFASIMYQAVVSYLDDLFCYSPTLNAHLKDLEKVFYCVRKGNLSLNPSKCNFFRHSIKFLGYVVSADGISTDPDKISKIKNLPPPTTVTALKSLLGAASYYRRWIPRFAAIARPLYNLTKKDSSGIWTAEAQHAFETLKNALTTSPVLARADFNRPFILLCDASRSGLGCVLSQMSPETKQEQVILYMSRSLKAAEKNYGVSKLECLALVWAVQQLRPYLLGAHFTVISDHSALKGLLNDDKPTGILARWITILNEYSFEIKYRPGKLLSNADFLSRHVEHVN
jgi:predicted aspartyl protease